MHALDHLPSISNPSDQRRIVRGIVDKGSSDEMGGVDSPGQTTPHFPTKALAILEIGRADSQHACGDMLLRPMNNKPDVTPPGFSSLLKVFVESILISILEATHSYLDDAATLREPGQA